MKSKIGIFLLGLTLGIGMFLLLGNNNFNKDVKYIQLKSDYQVDDRGYLKKGTILRIDKGMSEGFTRYILYLNLKGAKVDIYPTQHKNEIIPYWLIPVDTAK